MHVGFFVCAAVAAAGLLWTAGAVPLPSEPQGRPCAESPNTPLPDLTRPYRGLAIGLYPGGRTTPPEAHLAAGLDAARRVRPLDATGRPSGTGRVILLSLGMSNTSSEFGRFATAAAGTPAVNPRLTIVNGALSGAGTEMWGDPASRAWQHARAAVRGGGTSEQQVQVIWMKHARLKTEPFPEEVEQFARDLDAVVRIAAEVFPNLEVVYVSSRTRSGAETRRGPGEPQAYESGFAVRGLVERRVGGGAPWVGWGPYLWANGAPPRSDRLAWTCADLQQDLLHPSEAGNAKVADQLLAFFAADPTAVPWFLDAGRQEAGAPPGVTASPVSGRAPLDVRFSVAGAGQGQHFWTFGDGTSSGAAAPAKTFHLPGDYDVQLTIVASQGRWRRQTVRVTVAPGED